MGAYRIDRRGSVEEEFFTDQGEAKARTAVLERDPNAENPVLTTERNHHWMADDAVWYCARWNHVSREVAP
jgi:hypothetical protein